jgi:hypothetical protein
MHNKNLENWNITNWLALNFALHQLMLAVEKYCQQPTPSYNYRRCLQYEKELQ